jgi:hypothetical protein
MSASALAVVRHVAISKLLAGGLASVPAGADAPRACHTRQLNGLAVISSDDVWTVGIDGESSGYDTLIEHWDGAAWTEVTSPSPGSTDQLLEVAGRSSTDVWAVGITYQSGTHTLTEHWDGTAWAVVPSPSPTDSSFLKSVSVAADGEAWAVGYYANPFPDHRTFTLVEHWDGSAWTLVPSPSLGDNSDLYGVAVVDVDDVWAVGSSIPGSHEPQRTLVEHWDGASWTIVPSDNAGGHDNELLDVAASSGQVWATGDYVAGPYRAVVEHLVGNAWKGVSTRNLPGGTFPEAITAVAPGDVWIAGQNIGQDRATIFHRQGRSWTQDPLPAPVDSSLGAIRAVSAQDVWAAGLSSGSCDSTPMTLHWDGVVWTLVPIP